MSPIALSQARRLKPVLITLGILLVASAIGLFPHWPRLGSAEPSLPGIESPSRRLDEALARCRAEKGAGYVPRTEHLEPDGSPSYTNRLVCESSPYLLQHAHNPVNWYPFGDEAFRRARERNVPVLLSIGYSTCHWCHVMERESFEDEEIAAYLNASYVAIKVDREERPDVDEVYMSAIQVLTGRGGWPMTVVLTPDREPFFGGTYFPPRSTARGPGLLEILQALSLRYREEPDKVVTEARQLTTRILQATMPTPGAKHVPTADAIDRGVRRIASGFDALFGGFGFAPKFPRPVTLELLLRYHRRTRDEAALRMVTVTLDHMARGGIYDHVGGGFHRYATDQQWLVPHFEKMLYDNAQLAVVYLEAWQLTRRPELRRVVEETLDYVARELTDEHGGFHSATDADSMAPSGEQEEGWFFTWSESELGQALGAEDLTVARALWNTSARGNFEGRNILHEPRSRAEAAAMLGMGEPELEWRLVSMRRRLYAARLGRPAPHLDDKIIASWNGLMVSALARAGFALDRIDYVERARRAAGFLLMHLRSSDGRLLRSYREGRARHAAVLDDYAFVIAGLLDLFEADGAPKWLREALALQERLDRDFWHDEHGGYFLTSSSSESLLARPRPGYDGAEPAGNSVAALNLLRLAELTLDDAHRLRAERLLAAFGTTLTQNGSSAPLMLAALDRYLDQALEVVIVDPAGGRRGALADVLRRTYLPQAVLTIGTPDALAQLVALTPYVEGKVARDDRATAYVCRRSACELPTSDPAELSRQLARAEPYVLGSPRRPLAIGKAGSSRSPGDAQ
jgi:uncharacterized protein YyaL (SSP411 family)